MYIHPYPLLQYKVLHAERETAGEKLCPNYLTPEG